jgi:hypothetical protein
MLDGDAKGVSNRLDADTSTGGGGEVESSEEDEEESS